MSRIVPALFLAFVSAMLVFAFWHRSGPPLPATEVRISTSMVMSVGYAGNAQVAVGERGRVFKEVDGVWKRMPTPTEAALTRVTFANDQLGLAVGHDAVILRTQDGGSSWTQVYADPEAETPLMDVLFVDADRAYAVGAYGLFLESTDGGLNWAPKAAEEEAEAHYNAITKLADGTLMVVGEFGTLLRSADQGATWSKIESPYEGSYFGVVGLDEQQVVAFGMRGRVVLSQDGGNTFVNIETPITASLFGALVQDNTLYLAGQSGEVLYSRDGGLSFARVKVEGSPMLTAMAPAAQGQLRAFGEHGLHLLQTP